MKKIITSLCYVSLIMCLVFVTSCNEDDKVSTTTLSGIVSNENGEALEGITLTLGESSTKTDKEGFYKFTITTAGTYLLSIDQDGYEEYTKDITLDLGRNLEQNIKIASEEVFTLDLKGLLSEEESEYKSNSDNGELYEDPWGIIYTSTFSDNSKKFIFTNFSASWWPGFGLSGGFTYTNKTDITDPTGIAAITAKGVEGDTYLTAFISDENSTNIKFAENTSYKIKGCYVTNTTYAYLYMKEGTDDAKPFEKDDYLKLTFIGKKGGKETEKVEYFLAKDGDITNTWEWVKLSALGEIDELSFELESSDVSEWGNNVPAYFSLDGIKIAK